MRAFSVSVLLCLACVSASAAKPGPAMFADWLAERTTAAAPSSTAKPAASPAYEEADYEWGCLRETGFDNCRCIGCLDACPVVDDGSGTGGVTLGSCADEVRCCATSYAESVLSCCEKKDYEDYGREDIPSLLTDMEIGRCEITRTNFEKETAPVTGSTVVKLATFSAVCNINRGEQCGHPFCDSMVLSWDGTVYRTEAVFKTNTTAPPALGACVTDDGTRHGRSSRRTSSKRSATKPTPTKATKPAPPKATKPAPQKAKKADAAEPAYYHHEDPYHREEYSSGPSTPTTYYKGEVEMYSGPATISSRKFNTKYRTAFIDFAYFVDSETVEAVSAAEAAGLHMVQPYKYIMKFHKEERY